MTKFLERNGKYTLTQLKYKSHFDWEILFQNTFYVKAYKHTYDETNGYRDYHSDFDFATSSNKLL